MDLGLSLNKGSTAFIMDLNAGSVLSAPRTVQDLLMQRRRERRLERNPQGNITFIIDWNAEIL
jgi:hypothetical protein